MILNRRSWAKGRISAGRCPHAAIAAHYNCSQRVLECGLAERIIGNASSTDLDGSGIATRRIKLNPEVQAIPIIGVTAYALTGEETKAREAGCDDEYASRISVNLRRSTPR